VKTARPRRWLSALKLAVVATTVALAIAATVVVATVGLSAWLQAQAGGGSARAQLERYRGWARGAEVAAVVVVGSVVGLVWSRTTGVDREGRR
jgi:hypothetical protein